MNKKGLDYSALMLAVVLICVVQLFFMFNKKFDSFEHEIGDVHEPLLKVKYDESSIKRFVGSAGKSALDKTHKNICSLPYSQFGCLSYGRAGDCSILNKKDRPREVCTPNFYEAITESFNQEMNSLLRDLPTDNYKLGLSDDHVDIVAIKRTSVPLKVGDEELGNANFPPSTSVEYIHKFHKFPVIIDRLKDLTKCAYESNPSTCINTSIPSGWTVKEDNDLFSFSIDAGACSVCYALQLPKSTQPAT